MKRAKVTVHMYVSIDGKIDGAYMEEDGCNASGAFYDEEIFQISNTNVNGANTASMYAAKGNINLEDYDASNISYDDYTSDVKSDTWSVVFDRKGRCQWHINYFDYANKKSRVIEVVTKQCDKRYLAFLRTMDIPYIIAGETDMDIPLALEKLKTLFGIEHVSLCGGAIINGAFLKQGCVDEISLVVAPYVDGEKQYQQSFELDTFNNQKFMFQKAVSLEDGGVQLIFKKKEV